MSTSEVYVNRLFEHAEHIFKLGFNEKGECSALAYSKRLHDRTNYVKQQMLDLGKHAIREIIDEQKRVLA